MGGEVVLTGELSVVLSAGNLSTVSWGGGGSPPGSVDEFNTEMSR